MNLDVSVNIKATKIYVEAHLPFNSSSNFNSFPNSY